MKVNGDNLNLVLQNRYMTVFSKRKGRFLTRRWIWLELFKICDLISEDCWISFSYNIHSLKVKEQIAILADWYNQVSSSPWSSSSNLAKPTLLTKIQTYRININSAWPLQLFRLLYIFLKLQLNVIINGTKFSKD